MSHNDLPVIVGIHVESRARKGIEEFLPEPLMGNMKKGTPEYAAKWAEKRATQLADAAEHPLFSEIVSIRCRIDGDGEGSVPDPASFFGTTQKSIYHALGSSPSLALPISPQKVVFVGTHPTTHARLIMNQAVRGGVAVPAWFSGSRRINPWHKICPPSEGEYPLAWTALGKKCQSPLEDTMSLIKLLGVEALLTRD